MGVLMLYMYIHVHVVTGYQGRTIVSPYVGMAQTNVSCVYIYNYTVRVSVIML